MPLRRPLLLAAAALFLSGCANHAVQTAPPAAAPTVSAPVSVSGGVMAGLAQAVTPPLYPPEAKAEKKQGTVILHAIIGKDGSIRDLKVISGPEIFRDAAVRAVGQWKYKPYRLMGRPVEVDTTITVNFRL